MAILAPSILAADYLNLQRDITALEEAGAKWIHIDVMDGLFVPNLSFGYTTVKPIRAISQLKLDVHLMIDRPIRYVDHFCDAGADVLTIHAEADTHENILLTLDKIAQRGVIPGICVKPGTPAERIAPYLDKCGLVLVMTVEPGFGGQKFMADMMPKLKQLRVMLDEVNPSCYLEVDGGVDLSTAPTCKENGADVLVAGSAFFKAQDKADFVRRIEA